MSITRNNISSTANRFTSLLEFEHEIAVGSTDGALLILVGLSDADASVSGVIPATGILTNVEVTYSGFELTFTGSVQIPGPRAAS